MPTLSPSGLDQAAARIAPTLTAPERAAWADITVGYGRTAASDPAARQLLTRTVDELVTEAFRSLPTHGARPALEIKIPGRVARLLPDWAHRTRADLSHLPSTQLAVSAEILRRWGWQNRPHHLRNWRGQRCICGAICTAVALGVGTADTAHQAAAYVLAELRSMSWQALIGDWNQSVCRSQQQAIDLITAARHRALTAGH